MQGIQHGPVGQGVPVQRSGIDQPVQDRFNVKIQRRLQRTLWAKDCTSWYLTADGTNTANWPGYTLEFRLRTRAPKWDDYAVQ